MRKRVLQLKAIKGQVTIDGVTFQHPTDKKNIQYIFIVFSVPNNDNTIDYILGTDSTKDDADWQKWLTAQAKSDGHP